MEKQEIFVTPQELARQREYTERIAKLNDEYTVKTGRRRSAFVDCYGCQQNEADAECMRGMLREMGYEQASDDSEADVVLLNTCAVREHAEMRVLGNVGALSHFKKARPDMIIGVGGCMTQQASMAEKLKKSFPYVDIVFGTHALWRLPELIYKKMTVGRRVFDIEDEAGRIAEGLPVQRKDHIRGWVSVMYGCNNFCSYCIVPYVRGRERSRRPEDILEEVRSLLDAGCREINLLGQNVNSYGHGTDYGMDFPDLLRAVAELPGEFVVRFMTSHPKDATHKLIDTMAACEKVAAQLHLPVQSGSDRILQEMNRHYTAEQYLELIDYARARIPNIAFTSDIIVGFPGETLEDFEKTLALVEKVRYHALFTFLYSPRGGTPAASMPDDTPHEEKQRRFERLCEVQNKISEEIHSACVGQTLRVLCESVSRFEEFPVAARTDTGRVVYLAAGKECIGRFCRARIVRASPWALFGEKVDE